MLKDRRTIDKLYGFNVDAEGNWRFGLKSLKITPNNILKIGNDKWKMTPGLFELVFHVKPQHYRKRDLQNYRQILLNTNAHKRNYNPNAQIKGTKSFKYQHIIKNLFNYIPSAFKSGRGLLKSVDCGENSLQYWDNPNELVDRLRLITSSTSVGHNNHHNEIISIIEELKEANIIK